MLSSLLACNHNDKLRDLGLLHPLVELAHYLLHVSLDLIIKGDHHVEAIFFDPVNLCQHEVFHLSNHFYPRCEILWWVNPALKEDSVDGVLEEFGDQFRAALER